MPTYIGENKIVDRYLGDKILEAVYIGENKVYDPYTEITGNLPVVFKSRATVALKNYRIYGTAEGAGMETETKIYGWHVDPTISDPANAITYLGDAVGKTPAAMGSEKFSYGDWSDAFFMPKPCMVKSDGTVDYYLDPNDYTKKADGTASDIADPNYDGNAMMQWPKIYWKYESGQTEGEGYFYVSNIQVDNSYKCWCNIDSKNNEIDYFYTAIYNGTSAPNYDNTATYNIGDYVTYTDTTYTNGALYQCNTAITTAEEFDSTKWTLINASSPLRSLSGIQTNQANGCGYLSGTIQENRALANNTTADTEWYFDVLSDRMLINGLLILMGKSLNTQAVFGNGITSGSEAGKNAYVTGSLNDKGLFYGDVSGTTTAVKVFGMENWWGHTWHRTAGLIGGANNTYLYKLTYNNYDGSTSTSYTSTGTGYLTAISNNTATNIIRPSNNVDGTTVYWWNKAAYGKWGYLPIQVGGSSTTYYADYYYNGTRYLLVGGSSSHGAVAGASVFTLYYSFAYATWNIGACLSLKPLAKTVPDTDIIPHDYKLPLTVESGEQSQNIPVYIGDSKLGEEEYVDYEKQKIYKRTKNLWDGKIEQGGVASTGVLIDSKIRVRSCITNLVSGQQYTVKINEYIRVIYAYAGGWNGIKIGVVFDNSSVKISSYSFVLPEGADSIGVTLWNNDNTTIRPSDIQEPMLNIGSTAEPYVPYLQPTDPPVPLPPIPTYKGENTLDIEAAPNVFDYSSLVMGSINVPGGEEVTSNTHKRTPYIEVDAGSSYILQNILSDGAIRIHQYTSDSSAGWTRSDLYHEGDSISLDAGTKYVRMAATVDTYQSDTYFGLGKYSVGPVVIKGRIKEIT